jgi:hypothetical protein
MKIDPDIAMAHYAWKIKANGRRAIRRVTTLPELHDTLQTLNLPGIAPPEWVIKDAWRDQRAGHGRYVHNEGGRDEWSLIWTKDDDGPEL